MYTLHSELPCFHCTHSSCLIDIYQMSTCDTVIVPGGPLLTSNIPGIDFHTIDISLSFLLDSGFGKVKNDMRASAFSLSEILYFQHRDDICQMKQVQLHLPESSAFKPKMIYFLVPSFSSVNAQRLSCVHVCQLLRF